MAKKISRHLPGLSLGETAPASKGIKQPKRNGHAFHPIMNKGGAHEKSKGAKRAAAKRQTNQSVREWLGRSFRLVLLSSFIITGCQPETPQGSVTSSEEIPQTAGRSLEDQAYLAQLVRQSEIADSERSLVHVSHTCTLTIDQKTYAVVDMRELVKGATTARGVNQIILLSAENQMVNKI